MKEQWTMFKTHFNLSVMIIPCRTLRQVPTESRQSSSGEWSHAWCGEEFTKATTSLPPLSPHCVLWSFVMPSNPARSSKQRSTWTQKPPCLSLCDSMTGISRLTPRTGHWRGALKSLTLWFYSTVCQSWHTVSVQTVNTAALQARIILLILKGMFNKRSKIF